MQNQPTTTNKKDILVLPKGNSGRSIKPCFPQSGVWKASGWHIRWAFSLAACKPSFISLTVSKEVSGSKWQLTPTIEAPRRRKVTLSHSSPGSGRWRFHSTLEAVLSILTSVLWNQGSCARARHNSPEVVHIIYTSAALFTFLKANVFFLADFFSCHTCRHVACP